MIDSLNDRSAVFNLLRLVREQNEMIHHLQSMLGALMWMVLRGDDEKMREFAAMHWQVENARPPADSERQDQWESWLLSAQRDVERGHPDIPS